MKVLIFGHSFVRDLLCLGDWNREVELEDGSKENLEFLFRYYSGKDFDYFLSHLETFEVIKNINPDAIVIVLGGNLIVDANSNSAIKLLATDFYNQLKQVIRPECIKFATQIEPRFCKKGNRFGTPEAEEFNRRRTQINNHFGSVLKKRKLVDYLVFIREDFKYSPELYKPDGIHLSKEGLELLKGSVIGGIVYALNRKQ